MKFLSMTQRETRRRGLRTGQEKKEEEEKKETIKRGSRSKKLALKKASIGHLFFSLRRRIEGSRSLTAGRIHST